MTLEELPDRYSFGAYLTANGYVGTGVEVGVFKGEFSKQILSQWAGHLIGVDCYNNGTEKAILTEALVNNAADVRSGRYTILVCDQLKAASAVKLLLDFVYLDAEHTHAAVSEGIKHWYPKVRSGGLICGHDMDASGGVHDAVMEFVTKEQLKLHHTPCSSWFAVKP